jgi:sarcosine oxidase
MYDLIVLGTGGVGSAATFHAARRGLRVLGIDRFPWAHDRGSSHGHTRIIRMAYFEHPDYVPLLRRAYDLWDELSKLSGVTLFERTGLLQIGPMSGIVIPGVLQSATEHQLPIEQLDTSDVERRFPGFRVTKGCDALFEKNAGYLLVETCVRKHLELAKSLGGEFVIGESVTQWHAENDCVVVETDRATYQSKKLIITAGAWANSLIGTLGMSLTVRRKHLHWRATNSDVYRNGPCFFYEMPNGFFYGFPHIDERGIKVAEHSGGETVDDPRTASREEDTHDTDRIDEFLGQAMLDVSKKKTAHEVCFYTMSPDENFFVDRHPQYPNVAFAAGLSGHGFKFASTLGEILVDLVFDGGSKLPVDFLSVKRRVNAS